MDFKDMVACVVQLCRGSHIQHVLTHCRSTTRDRSYVGRKKEAKDISNIEKVGLGGVGIIDLILYQSLLGDMMI